MKKLLSLLSVILTTGTFATNVISCASKSNIYDHKGADGGSYLYYLPQNKNNQPDFSTTNLWSNWGLNTVDYSSDPSAEVNLPISVRESITQNIMNIVTVAAMKQLGDSEKPITPFTGINSNVAQFGNFKNMFSEAWSNLNAIVDNEISNQKTSQGKNWSKWLKDNYDSSETEYRSHLLEQGDGTPTAASMTADLLANNYQADYDYDQTQTTTSLLALINNTDSVKTWSNAQTQQIAYATLGITLKTSDINAFKNDFSTDMSAHAHDYTNLIGNNSSFDSTKQYLPISKSTMNNNSNFIAPSMDKDGNFNFDYQNIDINNLPGLLSPSQEFIEANWFKAERPLAVSQILVKYDNTGGSTFDITKNKISGQNWNDLFSQDTEANVTKLLGYTGNDNNVWNDLTNQVSQLNDSNISATYESSLLTADASANSSDGFANDNFKSAVYNSISGYSNGTNTQQVNSTSNIDSISKIATSEGFADSTVNSEIQDSKKADYNSDGILENNDMFHIYSLNTNAKAKDPNDNVIIYFDSLGMHIVHIDGIDALQSVKNSNSDFLTNYTRSDQNANIRNYNNFFDINKAGNLPSFNNQTNSAYLDWLNNNSYVTNKNIPDNLKQHYTYNLDTALKTFATYDSTKTSIDPTSTNMWFWEFELLMWYITGNTSGSGDDSMLKYFLNFTNSPSSTIVNDNIQWIFSEELEKFIQNLNTLYQSNFNTSLINIMNNASNNKNGAQGTIASESYNINSTFEKLWDTWNNGKE